MLYLGIQQVGEVVDLVVRPLFVLIKKVDFSLRLVRWFFGFELVDYGVQVYEAWRRLVNVVVLAIFELERGSWLCVVDAEGLVVDFDV